MKYIIALILFVIVLSCKSESEQEVDSSAPNTTLFSDLDPDATNVIFANNLVETYQFNFITYPYIYIGGGVAVGDINNDGLDDIYFTSNQNANALYLNQGNLEFENITSQANVLDDQGWSTGVSMVDINNDGWLDIYVCKSASLNSDELRRNKLFINQKNNTFVESAAAYGLDHFGFSTQSYFFDYDNDGDLDMYLVNHRYDFRNNGKISSEIQRDIQERTSDQMFRNDGDTFTNVSREAGIMNKAWGLSAAIGDYNNDGWIDVYVANDYLEPDMLYINNQDGSFRNEVLQRMNHISFNSMGSDLADVNNDKKPDLLVLDMLAEDHARGKENMATMSTENFYSMVNVGYHRQYMANVLQLNNADGQFSDIGQLAGITKTDWSWAPLIADFDNDGYKDVFITNGIEKDLGNQDFRRQVQKLNSQGVSMSLDSLLNMAPGEKLPNYIFKNNGDLTFTKMIEEWGFEKKVNSNGVAYSDLDNDGDLDLVINNSNDLASVYRNNASENNYIKIKLNGNEKNKLALGSKIELKIGDQFQYQELYLNRGFQSSVSPVLNFGLASNKRIDELKVIWPDGKVSLLTDIEVNQMIELDYINAENQESQEVNSELLFAEKNPEAFNLNYKHQENNFNDFSKQLLLPQKQSTIGPCMAVGDLNGDNLDDVFLGGGPGQSAMVYFQTTDGKFSTRNIATFMSDRAYEDTDALMFDADNDNDLDIYVTSSGYELSENDQLLQDRLYINEGNGNFTKAQLPTMLSSTKAVKPIDYDKDGDLDLVIGGRVIPGKYPLPPNSYILENKNGSFIDVTETIAPEFKTIGMVSAIEVMDHDNDGDQDLMVVGPWMPLTILNYEEGQFIKQDIATFDKTQGWYYAIASHDFDQDGDLDFVVGNIGNNNKFNPSLKKPLYIFSNYFDDNESYDIALSKVYKGELVPVRGKECSTEQTPFLAEKIETYSEFASLNIEGVYGEENINSAYQLTAYNFSSIYVENKGNGNFEMRYLPNFAQLGPSLDFVIEDVNKDGYADIVGVGNLYDAEVETIRYDASRGYILLGDGQGNFEAMTNSGFACNKDMRKVKKITIGENPYLIVASNNDKLSLFSYN